MRRAPGAAVLPILPAALVFVPPLAVTFGRVPLSRGLRTETAYGPLNRLTCLFNRHYAAPSARAALAAGARRFSETAPGRRVSYLDAGFPSSAWFPMPPHLCTATGEGSI